jgi:hypothetical protein
MFVAAQLTVRRGNTIKAFFLLGWLLIACFFLSMSAMAIAIARFEGTLGQLRVGWVEALALAPLLALTRRYSLDMWKARFSDLERNLARPECSATAFF